MVIAGVKILKRDEKKLEEIGVKDSKILSPKRREELAREIEKIAKDIVVLRVQPCKIDSYRARGINLDKIEAMKMAQIIEMLDGDKIYVDSLEQNTAKFKNLILSFLPRKNYNLIVENYLDESVKVVGAASIIAKVERDREIEKIKRKVNYDFGVGYSHDIRTIEFVKKILKESKGKLPPYIRKSWITAKELQKESLQKKIKDFIFGKKEKCSEGNED
jgi:ribonuclease HII